MYKYIYLICFIISLYLFYINFNKIDRYKGWLLKSILLLIAAFVVLYSMFYDNRIINNIILPILLILNISILIYITFKNKYTIINLIPIIGLLYILYNFNIKDFHINKGKLIKPNKKWIYSYKIGNILLLLFPLLFSLNEYFMHRIFILCLMVQLSWLL
jgi:hypothetical protein